MHDIVKASVALWRCPVTCEGGWCCCLSRGAGVNQADAAATGSAPGATLMHVPGSNDGAGRCGDEAARQRIRLDRDVVESLMSATMRMTGNLGLRTSMLGASSLIDVTSDLVRGLIVSVRPRSS